MSEWVSEWVLCISTSLTLREDGTRSHLFCLVILYDTTHKGVTNTGPLCSIVRSSFSASLVDCSVRQHIHLSSPFMIVANVHAPQCTQATRNDQRSKLISCIADREGDSGEENKARERGLLRENAGGNYFSPTPQNTISRRFFLLEFSVDPRNLILVYIQQTVKRRKQKRFEFQTFRISNILCPCPCPCEWFVVVYGFWTQT